MKKTIKNRLRMLGCMVLSASFILSACKSSETTKKKKTKKTTEKTESTDEPIDPTDDPTDPTDPTVPSNKKYTGDDAGVRLHELDEEIFKRGYTDIISVFYDLENPETYGIEWPEVGIEPWSPDDEAEDEEFVLYVLETLDEIDINSLELEDKVLYETMVRDYTLSSETFGMDYYTGAFNSLTGINTELPMMLATMIFDDQEDVEHYLLMLADVAGYLDSLFQYEQKRAELGRTLPDDCLKKTIESVNVVHKDHEGSFMYTTFEDRVNALDLDDTTKQQLIAKNKEILDTSFYPGYEALEENLKTLLGTATTSGKICEMDGGKEYYEKYFQYRSGTNLTIAEAKAELEQAMMDDFTEISQIYANLTKKQAAEVDKDHDYTTGSFESDIEFCIEAIKTDFPDIGNVYYTVYHAPEELGDNLSPAAYISTPIDDVNKNMLMINDYSDGVGGMLPTVAHEAFPGHLYETVYHMLHMNNFYQKSGTTAYKEGWSTYSENYIMKLSDYDYDVYRVNYVWLDHLLNYVVPAYIDICVHYDGMSKDQVAEYFDDVFGAGMGDAIVEAFYDRTIEIPGYVLPYCFGNLNCCRIINGAAEKYGSDYTMSEIHAAYLDMGPSSFEILEKYMPLYVEKQH